MTAFSYIEIPLDQIEIGERLRAADENYVQFLASSIADQGLTNPLTVGEKKKNGKYPLLAGMHRFAAANLLEWEKVAVIVRPVKDELEQKLIEIDENLHRRELSQLDRAKFLGVRQEIYEVLFPETKGGIAGGLARQGSATDKLSFAEDAAAKIGITARSIRRSIQRYKGIDPKVAAKIASTWIADKGTELDALIKLDPTEQMAAVDVMLDEDTPAKSVGKALPIIRGEIVEVLDPEEQSLEALKTKFSKSSETVKAQFIAWQKELGIV